jgi:DNA-binding transcriptional LysR family regulator
VPRLRLALKADIDAGLLPRILDVYAEEKQALPVELVLGGFGEQAQTVRSGGADVGLVLGPFDDRGLDAEPLVTEPLLIALAAADPLAARPCLALADLAGRSLPGGSPADSGSLESLAHQDAGRPPEAGAARTASDLAQILRLVEFGSIVCYIPDSVAGRYPRPEIAYRPVGDLQPAALRLYQGRERRLGAGPGRGRHPGHRAPVRQDQPARQQHEQAVRRAARECRRDLFQQVPPLRGHR